MRLSQLKNVQVMRSCWRATTVGDGVPGVAGPRPGTGGVDPPQVTASVVVLIGAGRKLVESKEGRV